MSEIELYISGHLKASYYFDLDTMLQSRRLCRKLWEIMNTVRPLLGKGKRIFIVIKPE